jgi:hypothetical protein
VLDVVEARRYVAEAEGRAAGAPPEGHPCNCPSTFGWTDRRLPLVGVRSREDGAKSAANSKYKEGALSIPVLT